MDWIKGMQKAIDYIEANLTEEINYEDVAAESFSSSYHFQRMFSILCGYTLGEYIRMRRLSLAGKELAGGKEKVIDVALKYGYDSPDSFAKSFYKFHGITPSQARADGSLLKSFSRLSIRISLEGGIIMNYRIETKPQITLLGYKRRFEGMPYDEQRHKQEESFFISTRAHQWMLKGMSSDKLSDYCVITNMDDSGYDFYISCITVTLRELILWINSTLKKLLFPKGLMPFLKPKSRGYLLRNTLTSANRLLQIGCQIMSIRL